MTTLNTGNILTPLPTMGFDVDTPLSSALVAQAYALGYRFCLRYLSLATSQGSGDLSTQEAQTILDGGLALMAVQHVRKSPWTPSSSLGTTDGNNAATNAASVGLPVGCNIWCDLEGVAQGTAATTVESYCNNWWTAVDNAGYVPGLYVGSNPGLTGSQIYSSLSFRHYWKAGSSSAPDLPNRGYQMHQQGQAKIVAGSTSLTVDVDFAGPDKLFGQVLWVAPPSATDRS